MLGKFCTTELSLSKPESSQLFLSDCRASYSNNWMLFQLGAREVRVPGPRDADDMKEGRSGAS